MRIVIIGGGPGGYEAAIRGAQLGADVTLIEKDRLGGTCLNRGCIPTKTFYKNAEVIKTIKNADFFGVNIDKYSIDANKIVQRKNEVVNTLVSGIEALIKKNKIKYISGFAYLLDKKRVSLRYDDKVKEVEFDKLIIATGSKVAFPLVEGVNLEGILTSDKILDFDEIYESLTILGGGVIGCEFASIFSAMGTKVNLIEMEDTLLSMYDKDISKRLASFMKKYGINVLTKSTVSKIEHHNDRYDVTYSNKRGEQTITSSKVLVATGRTGMIDGLNLGAVNIDTNKNFIVVDDDYKTCVDNIYAIGDVNGKHMLAHVASHQGIYVVESIMGEQVKHNDVVPSSVFTFPELSGVGITEAMAKDKKIDYKVGKFKFSGNGKSLALGELDGYIKVIANSNSKLLGVQILGPHASDLIHEATLAITNGMSVLDIKHVIHSHPTLAETFLEAVLDVDGISIHS